MSKNSIPNSKLFFIDAKGAPIYEQLQLEEALLRAGKSNYCLINSDAPKAIVLGSSIKLEEALTKEALQAPVPIIRRFSGGGSVVIDENTLFVTWIFNAKEVPITPYPLPIMRWSATLYKKLFTPLPLTLLENDYVLQDRKIGGNAQYLQKGRWLHHTSFLWDYCPKHMAFLQMPKRRPSYRKKREHSDFVTKLSMHFSTKEALIKQLKETIQEEFVTEDLPWKEAQKHLTLPHRKTTTLLR